MKSLLVILYLAFVMTVSVSYGQVAPTPTPIPQAVSTAAPTATPQPDMNLQVKDEILVPPTWVQDTLIMVKNLPVVGPIITKLLQWVGVAVTILTALVAFLLTSIRALSTVMTFAGLAIASKKVKDFETSKIMYWLKYFSMFNAEKKE